MLRASPLLLLLVAGCTSEPPPRLVLDEAVLYSESFAVLSSRAVELHARLVVANEGLGRADAARVELVVRTACGAPPAYATSEALGNLEPGAAVDRWSNSSGPPERPVSYAFLHYRVLFERDALAAEACRPLDLRS